MAGNGSAILFELGASTTCIQSVVRLKGSRSPESTMKCFSSKSFFIRTKTGRYFYSRPSGVPLSDTFIDCPMRRLVKNSVNSKLATICYRFCHPSRGRHGRYGRADGWARALGRARTARSAATDDVSRRAPRRTVWLDSRAAAAAALPRSVQGSHGSGQSCKHRH